MIGNLFQGTSVPVTQQMLNFTETRHQLLAGNIANMDTPGYRARDISVENFQTALSKALQEQRRPPQSVTSSGLELPPYEPLKSVEDSLSNILFHDGSDVSIEHQVTEMAKNQMMHDLAISIMSSQFQLLQTAISERV